MEEEIFLSISAMPVYENISPEELRWQDYQAKKTGCGFVCKFCNNAGSRIVTPSLGSPDLQSKESSQSSPAFPVSDKQNAAQLALSMLGSSSAPAIPFSVISTNDGVMMRSIQIQPYMGSNSQLHPITIPVPLSSQIASLEQNILTQMLSEETIPERSSAAPLETAFNVSEKAIPESTFAAPLETAFNVSSHSSIQLGISSLPVSEKSFQSRSISLLASPNHAFQKTVIRMQGRRHGSIKKDGPRVSFVEDYFD